ncbi:MAG: ubiquitin-conjugating enzyme E2 [Candidatus Hodarchaeota archaeon]
MPELPFEIWKDRINNEIKSLKDLNVVEKDSVKWQENNVELIINLDSLGFIRDSPVRSQSLTPIRAHRILFKINRSFPYPGGIDFAWFSNIFHPNIHPVELSHVITKGTGYICLNVLKQWSRLSDLETTVKALEKLVENPNPDDPLNYDICLEAAEFFKRNDIEALKNIYNNGDKDEKEDDDIIIVDD